MTGNVASRKPQPKLQVLRPDADWDARISQYAGATVFHTSAWAKVIQDTYAFKPSYLLAEFGPGQTAALPLFEVETCLSGRRGVSVPFADECAPLGDFGHAKKDLFELARSFGRERGWRTLEVRGCGSEIGEPSISFYGHELDLSDGTEVLFGKLASSVQRAIRKAEKNRVEVSFHSDRDGMERYYRLHCLTRSKHGLPPQPFSFFEAIARHILVPGIGFVALAGIDGRDIAGAVYFAQGPCALYKFGASDPSFDHLRPSNLVMWKSICRLCDSDTRSLDFGRTSLGNEGLRRYKTGWGASEKGISYFKWDFRRNAFVKDTDRSSGLQNTFFRWCPRFLSRILGGFLYRHLA